MENQYIGKVLDDLINQQTTLRLNKKEKGFKFITTTFGRTIFRFTHDFLRNHSDKKVFVFSFRPKNGNEFLEITPLNKGNLYKMRIYDDSDSKFNFHFYYGTKLLFVSDNYLPLFKR